MRTLRPVLCPSPSPRRLPVEKLVRVEQADTGWGRTAGNQKWGSDYSDDAYYSNMPPDAQWYASGCTIDELTTFFHRCGVYAALSGNTCRVADSALMVMHGAHEDEYAIQQADFD